MAPIRGNPGWRSILSAPRIRILLWFWRVTLGLLGLGVAFLLDDWCQEHWRAAPDSALQVAAQVASRVLDWPWVCGAAIVGWCWGMITVNRSICFGALACLVAGILTGGTATMLRSIVGRTRPGAEVVQGWYGPWTDGHWLVGVSAFNAFPSGHTATLAGIAVFAFRRRWPHGWMLASLTGAVGAARIVLAAHRLSDVVASILLALGLARVVDHCVDSMLEEAAAFWRPTAGNGPSSVVAAKETPVMGG